MDETAEKIIEVFQRVHGSWWLQEIRRVRYYWEEPLIFASIELLVGTRELPLRLRGTDKVRVDALLRKGGAEISGKVAAALFLRSGKEADCYDCEDRKYSEWFEKGR